MDSGILLILLFAICIVVIGAMRLKDSIAEHFDNADSASGTGPGDVTTLADTSQSMLTNPTIPFVKSDITVNDKLTVGSMMDVGTTSSGGLFKVGGDTPFTMKKGGYMGIGTTTPAAGLDITSNTGENLSIAMNDALRKYRWSLRMREDAPADASSNPDGALMISSDLNADPVGVMYLKRSGQVGIGTQAPAAKLHVENEIEDKDGGLLISNTKQNVRVSGTTKGARVASSGNLELKANGNSIYLDQVNGVPALGIGVPTPAESLHATGNALIEGGSLLLGGGGSATGFASRDALSTIVEQPGTGTLKLRTNAKDRMTIDGAGSVNVLGDTTVKGVVTANSVVLGDLTLANLGGKLQICAKGQPSSCRTL